MRERKFRGYRETAKRWVYGVYTKGDGSLLPLNCYRMSKFWELVEECVLKNVTEYTGLKDKNGKEIYEGDITNYGVVEWNDHLGWDGGGSNHPGFYFKNKYGRDMDGELEYHLGFDGDIEVIGNIYENPDLLK